MPPTPQLLKLRGMCGVTIEKKSHARQSLYRSDEQLHQCLPAALWLGLVDLQKEGVNKNVSVTACLFEPEHVPEM